MKKKIEFFWYAINYLLKTKILRKEMPFCGSLVINEKCNLRCRQCRVANRNLPDFTYEDIEKGLRTLYAKGIRSVVITGGEPFLWRDGNFGPEDVVQLARRVGFHLVSIYTNGTFPIKISTDSVFVSLDGLRETNNKLRGNFFDKVIKNIKESNHPNIFINFTINSINQAEIEKFCEEIKKVKQVKGTLFYFHTPYYGFDELFLNLDEKREIIERIMALKRKGYKILNSSACLWEVYRDNWIRPSRLCYVYADKKLYQCCRDFGNERACKNCGYLGYPEIINILRLRPSAIISALNYLPKE